MERKYTGSLVALTSLFFAWGFITILNDILIPYLKGAFDLTHFQANLVQFAFFTAYFVGSLIYFLISVVAGDPIARIGYKNGIIAGLIVAAIGCSLFYPAAQYHMYGFFLAALFCLGLGLTILQIAANPYVALLGSSETASSRLNLAQALNSLGTTLAPVIGGYFIFEFFFGGDKEGSDAVKVPYLVLAGMFLMLAVIMWFIKLPRFTGSSSVEKNAKALTFPHLNFGMVAIFCYVGAEVAIGSNLVAFLGLDNIAGLDEANASKYLSYYWGGAMIGRFLGAISLGKTKAILKYTLMGLTSLSVFVLIYFIIGIPFIEAWPYLLFMLLNYAGFIIGRSIPSRSLGVFAVINVVLLLIGVFSNSSLAMWSVLAIGLFNSIMWSNIFTLAIDGLGKYTSQASSLLVMMILGGALISPALGFVADIKAIGLQKAFLVPVICYVYLIFYGAIGYRIGKHKTEKI